MLATGVILLFFLQLLTTQGADDLEVQLPDGKIRGRNLITANGTKYYAFQQIPYAAPPVGSRRFLEPTDPKPWNGTLDATKNSVKCVQSGSLTSTATIAESEDCLFVNVYTPQLPGIDKKLPILVWIHGGGFAQGDAAFETLGPQFFMDYGIIVVTLFYRLGPLGFLTTLDGVIPGNLGLKDQRQALKWVNKNIYLFGGDQEKVTIAGQSVGAYSVSFQLLGLNNSYFRSAIQQSGSAIVPSAYSNQARRYAFEVGKNLFPDFGPDDSERLLDLLQKANISDLIAASNKVQSAEISTTGYVSDLIWTPVVETEVEREPILTKPMLQSFFDGDCHKVPLMLGITSEESLTFMSTNGNKTGYLAAEYDKNASLMISSKLNVAQQNVAVMAEELKEIYTIGEYTKDVGAFLRYSSDAGFRSATLKQAELYSKISPTYLYQFSYIGDLPSRAYSNGRLFIPGAEAVGHTEDLYYLWDFGTVTISKNISTSDDRTRQRLLKMWTNFVKYQNPTPDENDELLTNWPAVQDSDLQFLNINYTLYLQSNPRSYDKINELFLKYTQPPYIIF